MWLERLILLACTATSDAQANDLAQEVLEAKSRECCFEPGLMKVLVDMAEAHSSSVHAQVAFLTSPFMKALARLIAISVSILSSSTYNLGASYSIFTDKRTGKQSEAVDSLAVRFTMRCCRAVDSHRLSLAQSHSATILLICARACA